MNDPYASPMIDAAVAPPDDEFDVHVILSIAFLGFCAAIMVLIALAALAGAVFFAIAQPPSSPGDPPPLVMAVIMVFEAVFLLAFGAPYALGAYGLGRRRKWGFVLALVGYGLWLGGCCAPFAIYFYWALLRERTRKQFGF